MWTRTARANAKRSAVRAGVRPAKDQMGLFIRTIGLRRTEVKVGLANLVHNIDRPIFHERRAAMG